MQSPKALLLGRAGSNSGPSGDGMHVPAATKGEPNEENEVIILNFQNAGRLTNLFNVIEIV